MPKGKSTVIWEVWDTENNRYLTSVLMRPTNARIQNRDWQDHGVRQELRAFDWDKAVRDFKAELNS